MLEQTIRRADFHIENGEITPRFGPLMNDSQVKNFVKDLNSRFIVLSNNKEIYDDTFSTLAFMNSEGWKLESFASIIDVNQIRIQVAIFSRDVKIEAELFIS